MDKKKIPLVAVMAGLILGAIIVLILGSSVGILSNTLAKGICLCLLGGAAIINALLQRKTKPASGVISVLFAVAAFVVAGLLLF